MSESRHQPSLPVPRPDQRPVILFIWWPIDIIALGVGGFMLYAMFAFTFSDGFGLPVWIVLGLGLGGLGGLPFLISATIRSFRGRGFRGFWSAARATQWGSGT